MDEHELTPAQRRLNLIAVTAAMAATALIYGLSLPLLALVMHENGVDSTLIGLSTAVQSIGILLVSPFLPVFMGRVGPAALMLGAILVSLVAFLLLPVFSSVTAWFVLRFAIGSAGSVLWVCGEAWINQVATNTTRGRIVAYYSMAVAAGFSLGPFVLSVTGSEGATPFLICASIMLLSALPLLSVLRIGPRLGGERTTGLLRYLLLAPVAMLMCGQYAVVEGILLTFLPLYGMNLGLGEAQALHLIVLMGVGGIVGQLPIGWLADRVDRMMLAAISVFVLGVAAMIMPHVLARPPWNLICMPAFGMVMMGTYTIAMVIIGERFRGADLAAASALFGVMWGAGSFLGPPIGGLAMESAHAHGVPMLLALLYFGFVPFPLIAWLRRRRAAANLT